MDFNKIVGVTEKSRPDNRPILLLGHFGLVYGCMIGAKLSGLGVSPRQFPDSVYSLTWGLLNICTKPNYAKYYHFVKMTTRDFAATPTLAHTPNT
jgi:hypothetical protein